MIYSALLFPLKQRFFWRRVAARRRRWQSLRGASQVVVPVGHGIVLHLDPSDALSEPLFCGSFEWAEREWLSGVLAPGCVFYDVGAHIGYYSLIAAGRRCSVLAFEPTPASYQRLAQNVAANPGLPPIRTFQRALSSANRRASLHVSTVGRDAWNSLAEPPDGAPVAELPAETVRLDDFVRQHELPLPDVMKIDVEGWEPHVIEGGRDTLRQKGPALLVEFTRRHLLTAGSSPERLFALIESLGYRLHEYEPRRRRLTRITDLSFEHKNLVALR